LIDKVLCVAQRPISAIEISQVGNGT
jgi:hypothetical protein